jgi:hypothetical protein
MLYWVIGAGLRKYPERLVRRENDEARSLERCPSG